MIPREFCAGWNSEGDQSFELSEQEWGYEFKLRKALSAIWMKLFELAQPAMEQGNTGKSSTIRSRCWWFTCTNTTGNLFLWNSWRKRPTSARGPASVYSRRLCIWPHNRLYPMLTFAEGLPIACIDVWIRYTNHIWLWSRFQQLLWKDVSEETWLFAAGIS